MPEGFPKITLSEICTPPVKVIVHSLDTADETTAHVTSTRFTFPAVHQQSSSGHYWGPLYLTQHQRTMNEKQ